MHYHFQSSFIVQLQFSDYSFSSYLIHLLFCMNITDGWLFEDARWLKYWLKMTRPTAVHFYQSFQWTYKPLCVLLHWSAESNFSMSPRRQVKISLLSNILRNWKTFKTFSGPWQNHNNNLLLSNPKCLAEKLLSKDSIHQPYILHSPTIYCSFTDNIFSIHQPYIVHSAIIYGSCLIHWPYMVH